MIVYDQYLYHEKPDVDDDIVVYHSGFCSTAPGYTYGKDTRNYYLIHYVTKGKGVYKTGGNTYSLSANDGFLITPGDTIIHIADTDEPWDVCWVAFFGRRAEQLLESAGLNREHPLFRYEKDDYLERCVKDIYNESRTTGNITVITGYFYLFMGKLIEIYNAEKNKKNEILTFSHFDDAVIYIKRNIRTQISIGNLASYLRLDSSQVYRIFQKNAGCSPRQFIENMRMQKSCELLLKTDLSVKEISEWMGYEYQSHFTKQFKGKIGINPSDYRLQNSFRPAKT